MAELSAIITYLNELLIPGAFSDSAFNGLQVESSSTVTTVAVAVDAGESVIEKAIAAKAELLIVHHGLLWGHEQPISGTFGRKIRRLVQGGCSLYASHLPLDGHVEVGNNALLAKFFDLSFDSMFVMAGTKPIGVAAHSPTPRSIDFYLHRARGLIGFGPHLVLPFGPAQITRVGIVSGSGSSELTAAAELGMELLISGEPKQSAYHQCKELGINALFAGHYATETVGVRAVGDLLHNKYGITSIFIDEPTGI